MQLVKTSLIRHGVLSLDADDRETTMTDHSGNIQIPTNTGKLTSGLGIEEFMNRSLSFQCLKGVVQYQKIPYDVNRWVSFTENTENSTDHICVVMGNDLNDMQVKHVA